MQLTVAQVLAFRLRQVRLLPAFDPFVLGAGTGNPRIVDPARRAAVSRPGGWISPVVLAGGRVTGTWSDDGTIMRMALFAERAGEVDRAMLALEAARRVPTAQPVVDVV